MTSPVSVHIYDISNGLAWSLSTALVGKQLKGLVGSFLFFHFLTLVTVILSLTAFGIRTLLYMERNGGTEAAAASNLAFR
jgi:hypothetical protein